MKSTDPHTEVHPPQTVAGGGKPDCAGLVYSRAGTQVWQGDCLDIMRAAPAHTIDAIVTDPPAGIAFMSRSWDSPRGGRDAWIKWLFTRMRAAARTLKPGGHTLVWALPRTSHWTATAIEDAGLEVKDCITHLFATGYPKSSDRLKPMSEHWILARKPPEGSLAYTTAIYGTGQLNIDGCRVAGPPWSFTHSANTGRSGGILGKALARSGTDTAHPAGRWPPNLIMSHSYDCGALCAEGCSVALLEGQRPGAATYMPTFRWEPKAATREKVYINGKTHPTVKPIALTRWLVRLITPPGGVVLDPFAGSGTVAHAASLEGLQSISIEEDPGSIAYILARMGADA